MQTSLCEKCNTYVIWSQREGLCAWCLWKRGKHGQKVIDITLCPRCEYASHYGSPLCEDCEEKTAERKSMELRICASCKEYYTRYLHELCCVCLWKKELGINKKEKTMECSGVMRVAHCEGCKKGNMPWKDSRVEKPGNGMKVLLAGSEEYDPMIGFFAILPQPNSVGSRLRAFKELYAERTFSVRFIEEAETVYYWIPFCDLKAE